jgi:peptide/nickel transport system permease protein
VREYILRQVAGMIPVVMIVSMISFGLLYVLPGDPATAILGENSGNAATYQALRHSLGLDQPIWVQYGKWVGRVLHGDFGRSIRTGEPVSTILKQRIPVTLYIGLGGLLVGLLIGLPVAVISALKPGSKIDIIATVFALGGIAIPSFWQALIFIYVFSLLLHWFPPSGYTSFFQNPSLSIRMLIMPAVVLGTHSAAVIMRQARSALIEVLEQEYIVVARAKGLPERRVITLHALKNAMIPIVTILGILVGNLVAGAAITETVFAIPGVGRAAVDAVSFRDYPVLQGAVVILTITVIIANLLADVAYAYFDPRIRHR